MRSVTLQESEHWVVVDYQAKSFLLRCDMLAGMAIEPMPDSETKRRRSRWELLLVLPYLGLCFPALYARQTPALWGFPFFYWYQFAWVIAASSLMGIVYYKLRR